MAEPLTREEREILASDRADCPEDEMCVECAQEARWEATVKTAEYPAEHRLKALDAMQAEWLKALAESDALARRVEALRAALVMARNWVIDDVNLAKIDAAIAADDEAARDHVGGLTSLPLYSDDEAARDHVGGLTSLPLYSDDEAAR